MTKDEFLNELRARGDLDSDPRAAEAANAVLATLGERIVGGEARDLAAQLPPGVRDGIESTAGADDSAESFPPDEFVHRVAKRMNVDEARGRRLTEAVFSVLEDAVEGGELRHVAGQLGADYAPLLTGSAR